MAASISSQPEGAIALVTLARVAPGFFLAPFIGVIVDRFDRKRLMVTADLVRAGVYLFLPLVRTVPGLILASFLLEVFTMMWSPAKEATVPAVVPDEKLAQANSLGLVAAYATLPVAGPDPVRPQDPERPPGPGELPRLPGTEPVPRATPRPWRSTSMP